MTPKRGAKPKDVREADGDGMNRTGMALSVHADDSDWVKKARMVLERVDARDIASSGEAGADFAKSDRPLPRQTF